MADESDALSGATRVARVVAIGSARGAYGGPFDTALNQAIALAGAPDRVELVYGYFAGDRPRVPDGIADGGFKVRRLPGLPGFTGAISLRALVGVWRSVGTSTVVHISLAREPIPLAALLVAGLRRRPVVVQPHGMLSARTSLAHAQVDRLLRRLVRRARALVLALTERERDELCTLLSVSRSSVRVLGNPTSITEAQSRTMREWPRRDEVLFVGRLHQRKRVDVLIGAARHAHRLGWHEKYVVVGPDGGELYSVEAAARDLPNFEYEGSLSKDQVPSRLARAAVLAHPAANEPWGNVLAMALQLRTPSVVARSAALAGAISQAGGGVAVDDGDAQALATAAHDLIVGGTKLSWAEVDAIVPDLAMTQFALSAAYDTATVMRSGAPGRGPL